MQNRGNLSPGFVEVDEAVELIRAATRKDTQVDIDKLIIKKKWIETGHNFRIPLVRKLKPEEIYRTRRGKVVDYEEVGEMNVYIATNFQKELLLKAINDKFKELAGHEYRELATHAISTVADDAQGKDAVRPRGNTPIAKEGANIGEGTTATSNGDFAV